MSVEYHPSYPALSTVLAKYPRSAGCFFQAYNDLLFAQKWTDVEVIDLERYSRGAIKGRRPNVETDLHVVPCSLAESISLAWLQDTFTGLANPQELYLAVTSEDASIVYYKISRGIVKPPV